MDAALPPLTNFILPSGGLASAHLHVARSVSEVSEVNRERRQSSLTHSCHAPLLPARPSAILEADMTAWGVYLLHLLRATHAFWPAK